MPTLAELGEFNKAVVSALMSLLIILDQAFGISFPGITEAWVTALLAVLSPILVWLVPNKPAATPTTTIALGQQHDQ